MKSPVTKQEWIDALTKAKADAMNLYPSSGCICIACANNGVDWHNARFDANGSFFYNSSRWILNSRPSRARVAAVFDNSIQLIKEM